MNQDEIEIKYSYNEKAKENLINKLTKSIDVTRIEKNKKTFANKLQKLI